MFFYSLDFYSDAFSDHGWWEPDRGSADGDHALVAVGGVFDDEDGSGGASSSSVFCSAGVEVSCFVERHGVIPL